VSHCASFSFSDYLHPFRIFSAPQLLYLVFFYFAFFASCLFQTSRILFLRFDRTNTHTLLFEGHQIGQIVRDPIERIRLSILSVIIFVKKRVVLKQLSTSLRHLVCKTEAIVIARKEAKSEWLCRVSLSPVCGEMSSAAERCPSLSLFYLNAAYLFSSP
jgi:hypothetical protein